MVKPKTKKRTDQRNGNWISKKSRFDNSRFVVRSIFGHFFLKITTFDSWNRQYKKTYKNSVSTTVER